MKVQAASLQRYRLALRKPLMTAAGPIDAREGMIVRLVDEGGNAGVGDAAPLPGYSRETLRQVEQALERALVPDGPVLGRKIGAAEHVTRLLETVEALNQLPSAAHALDQALLELLATRQRLPVWRLLAGPDHRRDHLPVHALVATAADAVTAVSAGYRWLKAKVGAEPLERDARRLQQIRDAAGSQTRLRLDANGCWNTADEALTALDRLAGVGVHAVEQPVAPGDISALARVRETSPIRIMADESVRSLAELSEVLAWRAADAIVIKPMFCGGLTAATRLARATAAAGLPVSITTSLESGVGRHGALHVAAAVPGDLWSCGLCTGALLAEDLRVGPFAERGSVMPPTAAGGRSSPGLGTSAPDGALDVTAKTG